MLKNAKTISVLPKTDVVLCYTTSIQAKLMLYSTYDIGFEDIQHQTDVVWQNQCHLCFVFWLFATTIPHLYIRGN